MFAYIPARGGSKRVPKKNIRELGGQPVLLKVIETLSTIKELTGIGVSSEDPEILDLVKKQGLAVTLDPRDPILAGDSVTFMDLAKHDIERFSNHFKDENVLFTLATSALVKSTSFQQAIKVFEGEEFGLVMSITRFDQSPYFAMIRDSHGNLTPLFPESYSISTSDISPGYYDSGCFYIFDLRKIQDKNRFLDLKPIHGIELSSKVGIDVDTEHDWNRLEIEYKNSKSMKNDSELI